MEIFLAIFLGTLFGFALHTVKASNPNYIYNMLRLKNLFLMKVILTAIGLSLFLVFTSIEFGILNTSHISIKSTSIGVGIGGAILGLGWALSGYCPGTGLAAIGARRKDALFFVVGGLVGALIYIIAYPSIEKTGILDSKLSNIKTIALIKGTNIGSLITSNGFITATIISLVFIVVAFMLPYKSK